MYVISHIKEDGKREFIYSDHYTGGYPYITDDVEGAFFTTYAEAVSYIDTLDKCKFWEKLGIRKNDIQIEMVVISYTFTKVKDYL